MKSTGRFVIVAVTVLSFVLCTGMAFAEKNKSAKSESESSAKEAAPKEAPAKEAPAALPTTGQYKIGVVDRKAVMDNYKKVAQEYEKLKKDVDARQVDIDALSKKIEAAKEQYDKDKATLSADALAEREAAIKKDYLQYQTQLKNEQGEIDLKEQALMKKALTDIDDTIKKLAAAGGYHLVLDGNPKSTVIYFATAIDMTPQVTEEINKNQ